MAAVKSNQPKPKFSLAIGDIGHGLLLYDIEGKKEERRQTGQEETQAQHIRQCRRERLQEAYNSFRAQNDEGFWAERAPLVSSAIAAEKSAVMIEEASLLEEGSGL
ncbi:hypothetical protein F5H01DRAFT_372195 [Linnemannia elongata]|nr:hypothetical protein F5H01DRAFT_372195 [Linnemannia elongata]